MRFTTIMIGGSVRAAAFSVLRAGLTPCCIDLFADADLRAVAPVRQCSLSDYPRALPEMVREAPAGPIIFTGGLENHPQLIKRIAADRPLWGNDANALRKSRDPFFVSTLYRDAGICHPQVIQHAGDFNSEPYLRKPLAGAGGLNIAHATPDDSTAGSYFQQFIPGKSYSAAYCAFADRVELLGITEQLVGESWLHAKPFHYCGSIGPISASNKCADTLIRIGDILRRGCGLRGLFGVDFILHEGDPWPIEVNPRYTASMEVLEHATGLRTMERHRWAFEPDLAPHTTLPRSGGHYQFVAKAILFAPRSFVYQPDPRWPITTGPFVLPSIADVPNSGDKIGEGWPILTAFATGATADECRENLMRHTRELQKALVERLQVPAT